MEGIQFYNFTDESVELIKWDGGNSIALIASLSICGLVSVGGKSLFIHFYWKYAPRNRPFNKMFVKDQVCKYIALTKNIIKNQNF